jgi:hypothetical protein
MRSTSQDTRLGQPSVVITGRPGYYPCAVIDSAAIASQSSLAYGDMPGGCYDKHSSGRSVRSIVVSDAACTRNEPPETSSPFRFRDFPSHE